MTPRNATVAVVGAGDFIGAEIAKRFAREGFAVCLGRRGGEKLAPLVAEIEAAGGRALARSLDARKEEDIAAFLAEAEALAPLEVCIFNIGANVNYPLVETTERVFRKVWEMACYAGFLTAREAAKIMLNSEHGKMTRQISGAGKSASNDQAWRYGPYSNEHGDALEQGYYLTIWRYDRSGDWKIILDWQKKWNPNRNREESGSRWPYNKITRDP